MTDDRTMPGGFQPFDERVRRLRDAWVAGGRDQALLTTGMTYFAVYCWGMNYRIGDPAAPAYDAGLAEFVTASYEYNGGADGWITLLHGREYCSTCGDRFRLENLGICTGCLRHTCYGCGRHAGCPGELL
ncbi:hypothetical protein [Hamadaea tsunoensis]|uniref:hypothetical protein n=1 Tax=Hamadaea tsunoensis TaxID=53368 RepID=UPI0012F8FC8B|nr:hypothetical protein [Hamadaea tsunoensis]